MIPVVPSDVAVSRMLSQDYNATQFKGLIAAITGPWNALETATQNLLKMTDLFQSEGVYLALIGIELGFAKDLVLSGAVTTISDDVYRQILFGIGARNRAKGDRETWLTAIDAVLNSPANITLSGRRYVHYFDSGYMFVDWVFFSVLLPAEVLIYRALTEKFRGAGVRVRARAYFPVYGITAIFGFADSVLPAGFTVEGFTFREVDTSLALCPWFMETF